MQTWRIIPRLDAHCCSFILVICVSLVSEILAYTPNKRETETLSSLRVLDGSGWSKDKREDALYNVERYVGWGGAHACIEDLTDAGDAALSSLVANKVMAMARNCNQYEQVAFDLVLGIKL